MKKCKYCRKEIPEFKIIKKLNWKKVWTEKKIKNPAQFCSQSHASLYRKNGVLVKKSSNGESQHIDNKGFYLEGLESYKNQLIDYSDSPTGKAYIGINKEPLMPNKSGYGFEGVIIQDSSRQFIQCCGCGKWMKKITARHIEKCTGLKTEKYKKKFGLYPNQGLVSDETSLKLTKVALKNKESQKSFSKKYAGYSKKRKMVIRKHKEATATRQWQNKHGTCPEQLKSRLKEFILINREFPNSHNRGGAIYKGIIARWGSWNNAMKIMGLPQRLRVGTNIKFTFPDYTIFSYNINKIGDREGLFEKLIEKCKFLNS